MTDQEKQLYKKVKQKHYRNFNRIIKKVMAQQFEKLKHRNSKDADLIGSWLTVLEMDFKRELKESI